jgi:hypothetical protein
VFVFHFIDSDTILDDTPADAGHTGLSRLRKAGVLDLSIMFFLLAVVATIGGFSDFTDILMAVTAQFLAGLFFFLFSVILICGLLDGFKRAPAPEESEIIL